MEYIFHYLDCINSYYLAGYKMELRSSSHEPGYAQLPLDLNFMVENSGAIKLIPTTLSLYVIKHKSNQNCVEV